MTDLTATVEADSTISRWSERLSYAMVGVVIATFAWRAITLDWTAAGDLSVIRLRAFDVGTPNTPLVGAYSRFSWNHPGPSLSFAFAPWVRLFGTSGVGILVGALLVNLGAMAGALWVARRSSKVLFLTVAAVLAAFLLLEQSGELFNPWNPFVIGLPLFAALFARGVGLLVCVFRSGDESRNAHGITVIIFVGVLFICWLPPLIDQFFATGNLGRLIDFQLSSTDTTAGLRFSVTHMTRLLTFPPGPDVGFQWLVVSGPVIPWMAIVLLIATVVAARHSFSLGSWARCWYSV